MLQVQVLLESENVYMAIEACLLKAHPETSSQRIPRPMLVEKEV